MVTAAAKPAEPRSLPVIHAERDVVTQRPGCRPTLAGVDSRVLAERLKLVLAAVHRRDEPPDGFAEVAGRAGAPVLAAQDWLAGVSTPMSAEQADRLSRAYGVPASFLLDGGDHDEVIEQLQLLIELRDRM